MTTVTRKSRTFTSRTKIVAAQKKAQAEVDALMVDLYAKREQAQKRGGFSLLK